MNSYGRMKLIKKEKTITLMVIIINAGPSFDGSGKCYDGSCDATRK
jgi:hypothetical protein